MKHRRQPHGRVSRISFARESERGLKLIVLAANVVICCIVRSRERTRIETNGRENRSRRNQIVRSRERTRIETHKWRGLLNQTISFARESERGLKQIRSGFRTSKAVSFARESERGLKRLSLIMENTRNWFIVRSRERTRIET